MNEGELTQILDAVEASGVRTIVLFELRFNPYLRYLRWLRESGRLGELRFARLQYLSHVTDWYAGWEWLGPASAVAATWLRIRRPGHAGAGPLR